VPAPKSSARTFDAVLERSGNNLGWTIVRIPFDSARLWGKRGQLRVTGEINGFPFRASLFPDGKGGHSLLVNKKMQKGSGALPGHEGTLPDAAGQSAATSAGPLQSGPRETC
jgi:hypothetical protein